MITHFHMRSGQVCSFELDAEDTPKLIKAIKPREIFKRSAHLILGKIMMVTLNPQEIEWIAIEGGSIPKSGLISSFTVSELSHEIFNARLARNKNAIEAMMAEKISTTMLLTYGQATFNSGRTLLFETKAKVETTKTRLTAAMKIFEQPALFVQSDAGFLIVNPRNIATWQVVPGLTEAPTISVKGEFLKMSQETIKRRT